MQTQEEIQQELQRLLMVKEQLISSLQQTVGAINALQGVLNPPKQEEIKEK